jgi:hypothetical protein
MLLTHPASVDVEEEALEWVELLGQQQASASF